MLASLPKPIREKAIMMNRRSMLLGLGAAAVTTLAAPAIVRAESLMKVAKLRKSLPQLFLFNQHSEQYDDVFGQAGMKIGTRLRIRLPNDYTRRYYQDPLIIHRLKSLPRVERA